jgi:hypothetical protein
MGTLQLRERPWKLLALVVAGTVTMIWAGLDLIDGEITWRRLGHLSASETPVRFWLVAIAECVASGFIILGWGVLPSEWKRDYRRPVRPRLEDPDRTRPL